MRVEKTSAEVSFRRGAEARPAKGRYEPPRVVKSRRLSEVTGAARPVPSGAPVPPPTPAD